MRLQTGLLPCVVLVVLASEKLGVLEKRGSTAGGIQAAVHRRHGTYPRCQTYRFIRPYVLSIASVGFHVYIGRARASRNEEFLLNFLL